MKTKRKQRQTTPEGSSEEHGGALRDLIVRELGDIHDAEQQLVKALPRLARRADCEELREAFETHLEETEQHLGRLEQLAQMLGESLPRKKCRGMQGLIEESEELMEELKDSPALDAALIACAQKMEHYEIAAYGSIVAWARRLGLEELASELEESSNEEKTTDEKLTAIAVGLANEEATHSAK